MSGLNDERAEAMRDMLERGSGSYIKEVLKEFDTCVKEARFCAEYAAEHPPEANNVGFEWKFKKLRQAVNKLEAGVTGRVYPGSLLRELVKSSVVDREDGLANDK